MAREAALGFDVGTTSVKAGLLRLDGAGPFEVVGCPYPTSRPRAGWVEQEPSAWLAAMATSWQELQRRAGPVVLRAVGICSQVNTHVIVDEAMKPLRAAISWQDIRSAQEAAELDASVAERRQALWGGPFVIDASFSLSRSAWLALHEPAAWSRARWLLSPKDYCVAALCGEVVTDPISPVGVVGADGRYLDAVLDLVDGAAERFPPLRPFDSAAGTTREGNAVGLPAGTPLSVGTMDAWGSVFGSGVVSPGQAMEVAGTSEIMAVQSDRAVPTRGVITFAPVRGRILHAGPTQAGGAALEWIARALARPLGEVLALAQEGAADPRAVLFLPHLAGERAPHWNPDARGVFVGLDSTTETRHLALAVLEGVAFAARQSLTECQKAAGLSVGEVRLSGGAARSRLWNQVKATVHGLPMSLMEAIDSATLGAALLGLVAAGIETDLWSASARLTHVAITVEPDPAGRARLDDLYEAYRESYQALLPVFTRMARDPTSSAGRPDE